MKSLPEMLRKRADEYEAPYQGNSVAFIESTTSYAIATTMREIASMLESTVPDIQSTDDE